MIGYIGITLLFIATICGALALLPSRVRGGFFAFSAICPLLSFLTLVLAFISSDMSIKNVFLNSSSSLPVIYKIGASWASHEGSFLLWFALVALINYIYLHVFPINKNQNSDATGLYIQICSILNLLFLFCILYKSNPFEQFIFTPQSGVGLNPMLQDPALAIHPPMLYLGNSCFSPIFASTIAIMRYPQIIQSTLTNNSRILKLALFLLTISIGLGAWWAYRELGWGGYWFFDPVENISLLPWLTGVGLYHLLLVRQDDNRHFLLIILLSVLGYLSILYGTFIVRSGIISSVHAFAFSPERGILIFTICMVATIIPLYFTRYIKNFNVHRPSSLLHNIVLVGAYLWLVLFAVITVALAYPIYCYLVNDAEVVIDVQYFYQIFVPITIPILMLSALAPYVHRLQGRIAISTILLLIYFGGASYVCIQFGLSIISSMVFTCGSLLCLSMFIYLLGKIQNEQNIKRKHLSLFLGHFGAGLLAVAIVLNVHLSEQVDFSGIVGDFAVQGSKSVKLEQIRFSTYDNYYRQIASFKIEDNNHIVMLHPENRLYKVENSLSQEVDIFSYLFHDVYAVISRINGDIVNATIYFQPMISFIWFSVLFIAMGFLL